MGVIVIVLSGLLTGSGIMIMVANRVDQSINGMINSAFEKNLGFERKEKLFTGTHYTMSVYQYNRIRILAAVAIAIVGLMMVKKSLVIFAIIIYFALYPKEKINKVPLPFHYIYVVCIKKDHTAKNDELLEVLSLLKNMMVQLRDTPKGADYIIDFLSGTTEYTKPAFLKFLNLLRMGRANEAEKKFADEIGTSLAADTARILVQLDKVEPIALEQSLASIQNEIREIGNTHKQTRNELYGDLLMAPVVATIMVEFMNFLVVAYLGELSKLSFFINM